MDREVRNASEFNIEEALAGVGLVAHRPTAISGIPIGPIAATPEVIAP